MRTVHVLTSFNEADMLKVLQEAFIADLEFAFQFSEAKRISEFLGKDATIRSLHATAR
jgi:hypothetical protein